MKQKFYSLHLFVFILLFQIPALSQQFSLFRDINPGAGGSVYLSPININGVLFFRPDDGTHGDELWKTDGTQAGTVMVKDIYPGPGGSGAELFTNVNGVLFFSADDGVHGEELWKSDGTEAGTVMVKDIVPGASNSVPAVFFNANGVLFFSVIDGNGRELWKSDGTEAGTVMVKDIYPGMATSPMVGTYPQSGNPSDFTLMNGFVYFAASDGIFNGRKLWRTDGTPEGTTIVKNVNSVTSPLYNLINVNNVLFFTIYRGSSAELWKSDGTDAGTVVIGSISSFDAFTKPVALNGSLYFLTGGLWKSDGTAAGTIVLKSRDYGYAYSPELLTVSNGLLYFTGYDAINGWELWKSDGTVAGTTLAKDINPGTGNSNIKAFRTIGNNLMFTADDGAHGNEIWVTDGTPEGTKLVQDIDPGIPGSQQPATYDQTGSLVQLGQQLFTAANTEPYGTELWATQLPSEIGLPLNFLEFKGVIVNDNGLLTWKTDNEINTEAFIVERSIDGRRYNPIGAVKAASSPGIHQYDFTDKALSASGAPVLYYRLKQTDLDGSYTYSNIVTLAIDNNRTFVMLYPNPVKNKINLTINLAQKEKIQWQLIDNTGKAIKQGAFDLSAGSTALGIDITNISAGMYFMQLNGSTLQQVIKVIKQ